MSGVTRVSGPVVIVESSHDTPLVWFDIAIPGGAATDPRGIEGLHRHVALLARRGAGRRDRAELDETRSSLGAVESSEMDEAARQLLDALGYGGAH